MLLVCGFFFKPPRLQNTHHSEVSFSLQFHAKPLQLETDVQPFITFAADRLCRGSCAQAMFGVSHLRASGWWVWRKKLCEAEQFFPASACAWGPTGRRDRRWTLLIFIFLNFFFFFAFPRDWGRNTFLICKSKMLYGGFLFSCEH